MRSISLICLISMLLLSGCSSSDVDSRNKSMLYDFKEPFSFPFEVNEVYTEVEIDNPNYLHQFIFHYKNKQSTQEVRYILSKVIEKQEKIPKGLQEYKLDNGKAVYYEDSLTSQSLWWERDDNFLARFVYYINGNKENLGNYKLNVSELIKLANQVQ